MEFDFTTVAAIVLISLYGLYELYGISFPGNANWREPGEEVSQASDSYEADWDEGPAVENAEDKPPLP